MEDSIIGPADYDIYIHSIKKFQVNEIGSDEWFESHEILVKFNQQAILESSSFREEIVKDLFIANDKVEILVHEAYCVLIWRTKVLPKMLTNESDANPTFILYSILYHEATAISLMELLLYHENGCQALGDTAIDLIDYCAQAIVQLIGLSQMKHMEESVDSEKLQTNEELERQKKDLLYKIGLRCLTILSFIADKIDILPVSVARRMVVTHDVPCLFSEVLHCQPWIRNINGVEKFIDDKWIPITEIDVIKVTKIEAHVWFCLRQLLISKEAMRFYEINEFRQRELAKCQQFISISLLDQLPPLADLKHRLCTLTITGSTEKTRIVILEEVPEIKNRIVENAKKIGYMKIAETHRKRFYNLKPSELVDMAKRLSSTYNVELFEKLEDTKNEKPNEANYCAECCTLAIKKCSKCQQSYYCSRECQIKNWPIHKQICLTK